MEDLTGEERRRIAEAVKQRRLHLNLTQEQAADSAEISALTWRTVEQGQQERFRDLTLSRIALSLGWRADAVDFIRRGEAPPTAADEKTPIDSRYFTPSAGGVIADMEEMVDAAAEEESRRLLEGDPGAMVALGRVLLERGLREHDEERLSAVERRLTALEGKVGQLLDQVIRDDRDGGPPRQA